MIVLRLLPGLMMCMVAWQAVAVEGQGAVGEQPKGVSASTYTLDLAGLYREARLEDPRVLAAYARARSASEQQRAALGSLLPQVSANANSSRILRENEISRDLYNTETYSLSLTQYLYNKPAWERYQKSKSVKDQKGHEAEDALAEATVDLAKRYFVALAADDELELVQAERRATQKNLDRVSSMFDRQMAKITDKLDMQARVDFLLAQEVEARNQVQVSREALAEIVGRPITEPLSRVRNDVALQAPTRPLQNWVTQAIETNPLLKSYQSGAEAANAAVREGKGEHYPQLGLSLSAQQNDQGYDNTQAPRSESYVASIGVKIPIYSGGSTSARVRGLYDDQLAAEEQLEGVRRQVVKETTTAYLTAQAAVEKIRANRNALSSAQQSSVAAQKAFTFGVVNAVDVLTAVQNEFKARRDLLKTQYDFITNLFLLNRWAGELNQESVDNVNVWLSPVPETSLPGGDVPRVDARS
ncbi:TolC family outer membrane protein [Pseudomonas putida]|jgi:outer membrane protein|uniref:TolC family outer membrane protein n=2 Tax=Pseudomonas TaxID=286 RepID=A0ABD7BFS8_PSEPU|nr:MULTISPECIES: TolC family outer membrane protein [Pseudomonas]ERT18512.2 channel protein TolC [Pseudomonas putida SJ3]PTC00996.1 channel protein TolC [Thalassospira xiamenensis]MBH3451716.1 TolC family outer membrane protein [Pseudomonas putida]QOC99440.1 TolC family outer membrane protein [Pseudomonas putida]WAP65080.1 TolC family outer membrane protein [Pseudomonas putida]